MNVAAAIRSINNQPRVAVSSRTRADSKTTKSNAQPIISARDNAARNYNTVRKDSNSNVRANTLNSA